MIHNKRAWIIKTFVVKPCASKNINRCNKQIAMINKITALNSLPILDTWTITYSGKEDGKIKIIQQTDREKLKKIIPNVKFCNTLLSYHFLGHLSTIRN